MSWISLEPLDRPLIAITAGFLLLVVGIARAWILCHGLQARNAEVTELAAGQALQIEDLQRRLSRLESVSQAHEADERGRHDEGVAELLDSLLHLNESLRSSPGGQPDYGASTSRPEAS